MNDVAYDITYLFEAELVELATPHVRAVPAAAAPPRPDMAAVQEAMARELLLAADAHEEWIRQYMRVHDGSAGCNAG